MLSQQTHPKGVDESCSKHSHPSTTSISRTQPMLSEPAARAGLGIQTHPTHPQGCCSTFRSSIWEKNNNQKSCRS